MIKSVRIKHFKAIKDSGTIKLGPLTVFVGHNGTGKSSIVEALEFFKTYATQGLDAAIEPWYDFDHILWQGAERKATPIAPFYTLPMEFILTGSEQNNPNIKSWSAKTKIGKLSANYAASMGDRKAGDLVTQTSALTALGKFTRYQSFGGVAYENKEKIQPKTSKIFNRTPHPTWDTWMFLNLDPTHIGAPHPKKHSFDNGLDRTGGNLAQYLKTFIELDPDGFDAMIDSLRYILPYAAGIESEVTKDLINQLSFIRLVEEFEDGGHVKLPGWVMSGGTLRILSILAALRHPNPPSVLFIEELENGLDPRALGFLVEEIRDAISEGRTQVIATTHSPYLLDKLSLDHIITVDRESGCPPIFKKASDDPQLSDWSERFAPGSLYTMGMFREKGEDA